MFAKIVKGKDLAQLEKAVNDYFAEISLAEKEVKENRPMDPQSFMKRLKIYNVQQFVIGEVDPSTVALVSRQPVPTYSFCLLLICGYE
jgi:hypothetical protein